MHASANKTAPSVNKNELQAYLKAQRQWPRYCKVPHARAQLAKAVDAAAKAFWRAVLDAYGSHPAPRPSREWVLA